MFYEPSEEEMYDGGFPLPQKCPEFDGKFRSTIDKDLVYDKAKGWIVVPKEYPCWYGIKEIGFIWKGSWSDPYIEWNGFQIDSYYIEDTMWTSFKEDFPKASEDAFGDYMRNNVDEIIELLEMDKEAMLNEVV